MNTTTEQTPQITDDMHAFYERADQFIALANQLQNQINHAGKVNASMLYAAARYSASVAAVGFVKGSDYAKEKADIIEHFSQAFQQMLSDNIDDYSENFQRYTKIAKSLPNSDMATVSNK